MKLNITELIIIESALNGFIADIREELNWYGPIDAYESVRVKIDEEIERLRPSEDNT